MSSAAGSKIGAREVGALSSDAVYCPGTSRGPGLPTRSRFRPLPKKADNDNGNGLGLGKWAARLTAWPLEKIPNSHLMWGPFDSLVELARSG